jgi:chromate transporter
MTLIKLFITFFKIGAFSFGGGYTMIPIIQREIERNNWISTKEFVDVIGIAGMTPGPIAVNSATFLGFKVNDLLGALSAMLGIMLPSFLCVIIIFKYFNKFKDHELNILIFKGIKAVVVGLITSAAISVSKTSLLIAFNARDFWIRLIEAPLEAVNLSAVIILILSLAALIKYKIHPILVILSSAVVGITVGSFF